MVSLILNVFIVHPQRPPGITGPQYRYGKREWPPRTDDLPQSLPAQDGQYRACTGHGFLARKRCARNTQAVELLEAADGNWISRYSNSGQDGLDMPQVAVQLKQSAPVFFGWASVDCPILSAVLAPANAPLTGHVYLAYLQDRVAAMLDRELEPRWALLYLTDRLERAGLLDYRPSLRDPDAALDHLIFHNAKLHARLVELNALPGRLTLDKHGPRAAEIVEETSLDEWLDALTA